MYEMFEREFKDLPAPVSEALKKQFESLIRDMVGTYRTVLKNPETKQYQAERLLASMESIFQLAKNLSRDLKRDR